MSAVEDFIQFTHKPSSPLDIQDVACGGAHILVLSGELDLVSGPELAATIRHVCASPGTLQVTIDLRKLTFMDSTGVKAMLDAGKLCTEYRHLFRVIPGPTSVQRIFEITGLTELLPFAND